MAKLVNYRQFSLFLLAQSNDKKDNTLKLKLLWVKGVVIEHCLLENHTG